MKRTETASELMERERQLREQILGPRANDRFAQEPIEEGEPYQIPNQRFKQPDPERERLLNVLETVMAGRGVTNGGFSESARPAPPKPGLDAAFEPLEPVDSSTAQILSIDLEAMLVVTSIGEFKLDEGDAARVAMVGAGVVGRKLQEWLLALENRHGVTQLFEQATKEVAAVNTPQTVVPGTPAPEPGASPKRRGRRRLA